MNIKGILGITTKTTTISLEMVFRLIYFGFALALIVSFTFLFGFHLLVGTLKGGDAGYAYHNLVWFTRWFPRIPIWYPLQGGGYAFTISYPVIQNFIGIYIHKIFSLDLVQSLKVLTFSAYLFGAIGVYILGAWRLKNQTVGLIASLLFLALPGTFFWVTKLGYYAFAIASSVFSWGLIFFDWYLESVLDKQSASKKITKLFFASLIVGLSYMFHSFVGAGLSISIFIYSLIVGWLKGEKLLSLKGIFSGAISAVTVFLVAVLLFAFWFFPVFRYAALSSKLGGTQQTAASELILRWAQVQNPRRLLFDQGEQEPTDQFPIPPFPRIVTYMSLAGVLGSFFLSFTRFKQLEKEGIILSSAKTFGLGLAGFTLLFISGAATYLSLENIEKLRFVFSFLNFYLIAVASQLLVILAAFSIYALVWLITEPIFLPTYYLKLRTKFLFKALKGVVISALSLVFLFNLMFAYEKGKYADDFYGFGPPEDPIVGEKQDYGYKGFYFRNSSEPSEIGLNIFSSEYYLSNTRKSFAYQTINAMQNTFPGISSVGTGLEGLAQKIVSQMDVDQFTRVGLSGNIGAILQVWGNVTDAPTINQFLYRGSLIQSMRGFSETVFFGKDVRNHNPKLLSDFARWIGYKYIVTANGVEDVKHYLASDWLEIENDSGWQIHEFKDYQGMVTATQRPMVLVIGNKKGAYESVFTASSYGVLPYDTAWLVEGGERMDNYSPNDLEKYDGIILYGYSYRSKSKAFTLLDQYIKNGGKVFIDTGWQFVSKDWELEKTPFFFPTASLVWSNNLTPGEYSLQKDQAEELGVKEIPIEWEGKPWGISEGTSLREWARPILTLEGKTIMAGGEYGKGKVVWSGLNLFGYLSYNRYKDELVNLGFSIFSDLFPEEFENEDRLSINLSRNFPDKVEITLNDPIGENTALLWREPYSPDWVVKIKDNKVQRLPTYRSGPGFLLTYLPKTEGPTNVILEYKLGFVGFISKLISIFTLTIFLVLITDQLVNRGQVLKSVANKISPSMLTKKLHIFKNPRAKLKMIWDEE